MKNIYIASDHAGLDLKKQLIDLFHSKNIHFIDLGPNDTTSVDYPDYANKVCEELKNDSLYKGILICGSGQGMSLRANKFPHIRAALVYNDEIAKLAREHNDANVICLGSRFCSLRDAEKWIEIFINTSFSEGRHRQRVDKICLST